MTRVKRRRGDTPGSAPAKPLPVEGWAREVVQHKVQRRGGAAVPQHPAKVCPEYESRYSTMEIPVHPNRCGEFNDMVEGSIKQGLYHPFQMGYLRPNEECSRYRTPIDKLYPASSSCYPGYVAANTITEDLGIAKWWSEPEMVTKAHKEGLL